MPPETCEYHTKLVSDIAVIKNDIGYIKDKVCNHVDEGERQGGYRDRVFLLEQQMIDHKKEIATIKKGYWKACIVSGLLGGLIVRVGPDATAGQLIMIMED